MATLASTLRKKKARRKSSPPPSAGEEKKQRKPAYLKRKMAVSQPSDPEEKEADKVAKEVSRAGKSGGEEEAKEDKKMISSKPVPSAQRLMRRVNRAAAQQNEEKQQEPAAKRVRRSVETEDKEEQPVQRLFRKGKEDMEQAARRLRRAAQPAQAEQETKPAAAAKLRRSADKAGEEQQEVKAQARLFRAEAEAEEQQAAETGAGGQDGVEQEIEQRIENTRGKGDPLPEAVRKDMEQQFGQDFSAVVIHNDAEAAELCKNLNARAFTVGDDIYFAPGEFAPETESGRDLLAHELTHTLQQGMQVSRKIYRADKGKTATSTGKAGGKSKAAAAVAAPADEDHFDINQSGLTIKVDLDPTGKVVTFDKLPMPPFKVPFHTGTITMKRESRDESQDSNKQRETWMTANSSQAIQAKVAEKVKALTGDSANTQQSYVLKQKPAGYNQQEQRYVGNQPALSQALTIPSWDRAGKGKWFQVDHKQESQLGGPDGANNLWLLNQATNKNSGFSIRRNLRSMAARVGELENASARAKGRKVRPGLGNADTIMANWTMKFNSGVPDSTFNPGTLPPHYIWESNEIVAGQHLAIKGVQLIAEDPKSLGNEQQVMLFPFEGGGIGKKFANKSAPVGDEKKWWAVSPWQVTSKTFLTKPEEAESAQFGSLELQLPSNRVTEPHTGKVSITRIPGAQYAGTLSMGDLIRALGEKFEAKQFCPIRIDSLSSGPNGIEAHGEVLPTLPIFSGANLEFEIAEGGFRVYRAFSSDDIKLPRPLKVNESTLTVGVSSKDGLVVEGQVNFEIERMGQGFLGAAVSTGEGFALEGGFDFDSNLFDRAHIDASYKNEEFSVSGDIGIDSPDKIKGIKAASVHVEYQTGKFKADGSVQPDIPGVQQADLTIDYTEEAGLTVGGNLELTANPAIRSGSIAVKVNKKGDVWKVSATGSAQPAIPGVDSQLTVSYDDGAFTAEFSGAYKRGMLTAQVTVGASNRAVGEDGKPSGEPLPDGALNVYGSGSATIKIAPWLQGTAGIRFDPNGEVTVSGEIGIPNNVEIFARKELEKSLFSASVKVPIVPGIVAEVGGGLSAKAGIGPGVIDQLRLGIEYNPAHEENTHVTGDAHLKVPADAGLRLSARAGIGVGITGVSVTGGLEIGGTLGIEGAAEAGVHIDWTPATGLDLTANLSIHAQPNFTFDVSGYVEVEALFFTVYENRWQLASYQFGSGYQFGISLPIHYHEGQPFDISLDDVQFQVPDISVSDVVYGLIERIV
ncbi:DUF4157 domain-containing protein [Methylomonas sp. HYX-M1]|uniref:eCIS core domain-containing protein n=1 Tax=Methylomonas sp. HYX-M1 TaxID=3139307 RepID=UPI00345BD009